MPDQSQSNIVSFLQMIVQNTGNASDALDSLVDIQKKLEIAMGRSGSPSSSPAGSTIGQYAFVAGVEAISLDYQRKLSDRNYNEQLKQRKVLESLQSKSVVSQDEAVASVHEQSARRQRRRVERATIRQRAEAASIASIRKMATTNVNTGYGYGAGDYTETTTEDSGIFRRIKLAAPEIAQKNREIHMLAKKSDRAKAYRESSILEDWEKTTKGMPPVAPPIVKEATPATAAKTSIVGEAAEAAGIGKILGAGIGAILKGVGIVYGAEQAWKAFAPGSSTTSTNLSFYQQKITEGNQYATDHPFQYLFHAAAGKIALGLSSLHLNGYFNDKKGLDTNNTKWAEGVK